MATGNRFRSSFSPSCLPAFENGGHGNPPETISTPLNAEASVNLLRSSCMTFHCGRFSRSVSQACPSISISPECSIFACSSPSACPPAPAQSSSVVSSIFLSLLTTAPFLCSWLSALCVFGEEWPLFCKIPFGSFPHDPSERHLFLFCDDFERFVHFWREADCCADRRRTFGFHLLSFRLHHSEDPCCSPYFTTLVK